MLDKQKLAIWLLLIFAFMVTSKTYSQVSYVDVSGQIVSKLENLPVSGASIEVVGLKKFSITDENGFFVIKSVPEGKIEIRVVHIAYKPLVRTFLLSPSQGGIINILLEEELKVIEEIVISGGFFNTREETPYKIESISGDFLQKNGGHNIMDALSTIPGVNQISYGPGIGKPVIRGLSFSRVMVVYQGVRFENQQWGEDHGLGLNDLGVDRIEVVKGPASLLYGSGALGGVINIIDEKPVRNGIEGEVLLQAFSNTSGARSNFSIKGGNSAGYFFNMRTNLEAHADYRDGNNRTIGNSRYKNGMFKTMGGVQKRWGSSMATYTYNNQVLGIIEEDEMENSLATRKLDYSRKIPYQKVVDHLFTLQNEILLSGGSRIKLNVGHHVNLREENEETFGVTDLGLVLNTTSYDLKYNFLPATGSEIILGIQGFRQVNKNMAGASEILLPDSELFDNSIYGMFSQDIKKFKIQGGLRFDYRNMEANSKHLSGFVLPGNPEDKSLKKDFSGFTGSLGTSYHVKNNVIVKLNIASGFRAPDLAELFSNGEHPGTNRFERGNLNFNREQNVETDFSIHFKGRNISFEAAPFFNMIRNYIFFNQTDEFIDNLRVWEFEQDDVYLYGGEAGISIRPEHAKGFESKHTFSMVRGQRISDNAALPLIPADRIFHEIKLESKRIPWLENEYIMLRIQNVFAQRRIGENEFSTDGYTLTTAGIGATSVFKSFDITYNLMVNNVFNTTYLEHLAITRPFDIHNIGRNFTLGLNFKF